MMWKIAEFLPNEREISLRIWRDREGSVVWMSPVVFLYSLPSHIREWNLRPRIKRTLETKNFKEEIEEIIKRSLPRNSLIFIPLISKSSSIIVKEKMRVEVREITPGLVEERVWIVVKYPYSWKWGVVPL